MANCENSSMLSRFQFALPLIAIFVGVSVRAEDWPMFGRDQSRNAVSPEKNAPMWWVFPEWDREGKPVAPGKNIRWSAPLGTRTYGDPVVVDGLVWVGTNQSSYREPDAAVLVCLDEKSGKVLYRYVSPRLKDFEQDWPRHSMASSPLIEGDRMWLLSNRWEVVCMDIAPLKKRQDDPRELWKLDMRKELDVVPRGAHLGYRQCSIASYKDLIYVITGNGIKQVVTEGVAAPQAPSLVCLNKNSGKVVWKDNSPGKNILFGQWASPTVIEINGQAQVVAPQGDGWVRSFDAASGKLLWKFDTNPPDAKWDWGGHGTRNFLQATAVFHENRLYIGNGQDPEHWTGPAWLYCIDPTKTGDISPQLPDESGKGKPNPNSGVVWKFGGTDSATKKDIFERTLSNVAIANGLVLAPCISGVVHCLDARTGRRYWSHETDEGIRTSPLIVDGKVYVTVDEGNVWIFELAKEKKVLGKIELNQTISCSPVFANGVLYVASDAGLYAIAGNEKKPPP
jgi:outer membrane protein assembly factor BamB